MSTSEPVDQENDTFTLLEESHEQILVPQTPDFISNKLIAETTGEHSTGRLLLKKALKSASKKSESMNIKNEEELFSPIESNPNTMKKRLSIISSPINEEPERKKIEFEVINSVKRIRHLAFPLKSRYSLTPETLNSMERLSEIINSAELSSLIPAEIVDEILIVFREVLVNNTDPNVKQFILLSMSSHRLPLSSIEKNFDLFLGGIVKIFGGVSEEVFYLSGISLDVCLNLFSRCPQKAVSSCSKWLIDVILCCLSSEVAVRDKSEKILSFMILRLIEDYDSIEETVVEFFKDYSEAFGEQFKERSIQSNPNSLSLKYVIRLWSHFVLLCGPMLSKTGFFSKILLAIIETCFNNKDQPLIRKFCYDAWASLIFNFSLDECISLKKLVLLTNPIRNCFNSEINEKVQRSCFDAWLKLIFILIRKSQFYNLLEFKECFVDTLKIGSRVFNSPTMVGTLQRLILMIIRGETISSDVPNTCILGPDFTFFDSRQEISVCDSLNVIEKNFSYLLDLTKAVSNGDYTYVKELLLAKKSLQNEEEVSSVVKYAVEENTQDLLSFVWEYLTLENLVLDNVIQTLLKCGITSNALHKLNEFNLIEANYQNIVQNSWNNAKTLLSFIENKDLSFETKKFICQNISESFVNELDLEALEFIVLGNKYTSETILKLLDNLIVLSHSKSNGQNLMKLFRLFIANLLDCTPDTILKSVQIIFDYGHSCAKEDSIFSFGQAKKLSVLISEIYHEYLSIKMTDLFKSKENILLLEQYLLLTLKSEFDYIRNETLNIYNAFVDENFPLFECKELLLLLESDGTKIHFIPTKKTPTYDTETKDLQKPETNLAKRLLLGKNKENQLRNDSEGTPSSSEEETLESNLNLALKRKHQDTLNIFENSFEKSTMKFPKQPSSLPSSILKSKLGSSAKNSNRKVSFQIDSVEYSPAFNSPTNLISMSQERKKQKLDYESMNASELLEIQTAMLDDLAKINSLIKKKIEV